MTVFQAGIWGKGKAGQDGVFSIENRSRSSRRGAVIDDPTRNHKVAGWIPGLDQWLKDLVLLRAVV